MLEGTRSHMATQVHMPEVKGSSRVMQVFRQSSSGRIARKTKHQENLICNLNDSYLDILGVPCTGKRLCRSMASEKFTFLPLSAKYRLLEGTMGSGSFSITRCAKNLSTNTCVAMKLYSSEGIENILNWDLNIAHTQVKCTSCKS